MNRIIKCVFNLMFSMTLAIIMLFVRSAQVNADSVNEYVVDTANVINKSAARKVVDLNEHELSAIKDSPKLYVYTTKATRNMNSEAMQKLAGLDDSKKRTGIMILISTSNRQICVATGSGLNKALPNSWCNSRGINSDVRNRVKSGDYSKAVQMLSTRLTDRLSAKSDLVGVSIKKHKKSDANTVTIDYNHVWLAILIVLAFFTCMAWAMD